MIKWTTLEETNSSQFANINCQIYTNVEEIRIESLFINSVLRYKEKEAVITFTLFAKKSIESLFINLANTEEK